MLALPAARSPSYQPGGPCPHLQSGVGSPGWLRTQLSLQKESQKADEYLREIKDKEQLSEAVQQCIEAAGYEHEPETQKSLLRVSAGGGTLRKGCMELPIR